MNTDRLNNIFKQEEAVNKHTKVSDILMQQVSQFGFVESEDGWPYGDMPEVIDEQSSKDEQSRLDESMPSCQKIQMSEQEEPVMISALDSFSLKQRKFKGQHEISRAAAALNAYTDAQHL